MEDEEEQDQVEYNVAESESKMIGIGINTPVGFVPFFALSNWEEFLKLSEAIDRFKKSKMSSFEPIPEEFLKAFKEERGSNENVINTEK